MGIEFRHLSPSKRRVGTGPGKGFLVGASLSPTPLRTQLKSRGSCRQDGGRTWDKSFVHSVSLLGRGKGSLGGLSSDSGVKEGNSNRAHSRRQCFCCYGSSESWDSFACFSKQAPLPPGLLQLTGMPPSTEWSAQTLDKLPLASSKDPDIFSLWLLVPHL